MSSRNSLQDRKRTNKRSIQYAGICLVFSSLSNLIVSYQDKYWWDVVPKTTKKEDKTNFRSDRNCSGGECSWRRPAGHEIHSLNSAVRLLLMNLRAPSTGENYHFFFCFFYKHDLWLAVGDWEGMPMIALALVVFGYRRDILY